MTLSRMKNTKAALILLSLFLTGCLATPYPWKKETYVSKLPSVHNFVPDRNGDNEEFFVGDAYISVFVRPIDGTTSSGKSPYRIYFSILGDESIYTGLTVHSIKIEKNDDLTDGIVFRSGAPDSTELKPPFDLIRFGSKAIEHAWFTTEPIDIDYENVRDISILIDIEISHEGSMTRKTVYYDFERKTERGFLNLNEV